MKIISFSLYGNDERYTVPLEQNASSLHLYYPGWIIRVYHDDSVAKETLENLELNNVQLVNINHPELLKFNLAPKFWRFLPVLENEIEVVIFRDSDSIFSHRECILVNEWLNCDNLFHIMRDHHLHVSPILAGMFGVKNEGFKIISKLFFNYPHLTKKNSYNSDQIFLADHLYPIIKNEVLVHTSYFAFHSEKHVRINKSKDSNGFIGAVFINMNIEDQNIFSDYDFIVGIPFWFAKILRYRIRPVLYLSFFKNLVVNRFRI